MKKMIVLVALLAACGKKSEDKKDESKTEKGEGEEKGKGKGTDGAGQGLEEARKDPPPDAAPAIPEVPKLTTPPTPEGLAFEACEFDGTPILSDSFSDGIGDTAVTADGFLYVVFDKGHELRKYKIVNGPTCKLTLDPTWGEAGVLKADEDHKMTAIALDASGKLLVSGGKAITRYAGNTAEASCGFDWTPDRFAVVGDKILVNTFMNDFSEVVLAADPAACTKTEWKPKVEGLTSMGSIDRLGDKLLLVAKDKEGQMGFSAFVLAADGTVEVKFDISDETGADNGLCWSAGAIACGTGICIADNNCRKVRIFGADGKFVGNRDLDGYPWVTSWDGPQGGAAFLAATKSDEKDSSKNVAFIERVRGL